ncbi:hypothetical protein [Streptomyces sp. NBC_01565]|uniref:hypothetical protein n=1 Tax=unclassified Streptomyces TaxID=2593676 RepID=UPI00225A435E|nr:hypothetical protein [Streptomyces sp. NBC_01565]MCX4546782.1 hypothetical protein [Streptomyces sp. NBC_01565]
MDAQETATDDIDEQERDVPRTEPVMQIARDDVEGAHWRGILRRRQHLGQSDPITPHISLRIRCRKPCRSAPSSPHQAGQSCMAGAPTGG